MAQVAVPPKLIVTGPPMAPNPVVPVSWICPAPVPIERANVPSGKNWPPARLRLLLGLITPPLASRIAPALIVVCPE